MSQISREPQRRPLNICLIPEKAARSPPSISTIYIAIISLATWLKSVPLPSHLHPLAADIELLRPPTAPNAMAVFGSQPLNPTPFQRAVKTRLQRRPFMYFGLPFIGLVIFSSYALESFTKTRYDYQSTKVQSVTKEEQLRMDKNRKRVDLKEEYYVSRS